MILVTLGTQDKEFKRLLEEIQRLIDKKIIQDEIIVQAGYTKFISNDMKIFDLIPMDDFNELINKCDLLITHGGVGSILTGLKNNKVVIAVPRLVKYKEHKNDHQKQIVNSFNDMGYIIGINDINKLESSIIKSKTFKPKKYKSNTNNMINIIEKYIDNN